MRPHLLEAYGRSSKRLISALDGLDKLVEISLSVISESYLETKEQLISEQGTAIRGAVQREQSEMKFRGLLEARRTPW